MFIRRTKTRSAEGGKVYYSYRLVRSERSGERVRQRTLLNLGSEFAVATEHWAVLCSRIEQLLERQGVLVELDCPEEVEREAQRIAMQLVQRGAEVAAGGTDLQTVDVESLELERPRTVGVEHVGLWAMERLGLVWCLTNTLRLRVLLAVGCVALPRGCWGPFNALPDQKRAYL